MKTLLTLLLWLCGLAAAAQVDTLRSKTAIEAYLKRQYRYKSVQLRAVNTVMKDTVAAEPAHPEYWLTADFNHDGQADLFVAASVAEGKQGARDVFLILASDHKRYTRVAINSPVNYWIHGGRASWTSYSEAGRDYLAMACLTTDFPRLKQGGWASRIVYTTTHDTLFVLHGKPMIYTAHPTTQAVESIEFSVTPCFGTCPVFQLTIQNDGTAHYRGIAYVHKLGDFNLVMPKADLDYLVALLANSKLPLLHDEYQVDYTDASTVYLTVHYADGQTKEITDYGLQGTYGLATLYNFLLSQRDF